MILSGGRKYTLAMTSLFLVVALAIVPWGDELTKQAAIGAIGLLNSVFFPSNALAKKYTKNGLDGD